MKRFLILPIATILILTNIQAQKLKTTIDSLSYGMGILIAGSMKQQGIEEVNSELVAKAIDDIFKNRELLIDQSAASQATGRFMNDQKKKKEQLNKEAGMKFLAENAKREGVKTLPSGMQYEVIKEGDGDIPTLNDYVTTHYHGTLIDGTVFDSSYERGEPATFPVSGVIKGWTEALQMMKVGSKWKLYIPSELAYGERQASPKIAPNSTLVFEVELLEIKKQ